MKKERSGGLAEVLLLTGSLVFACLIGEAAFRLVLGDQVFERVNYRSVAIGGANQGASAYDSELGWVLRPGLKWTGFSTLPYGIRSNGNDATELRAGGVLAVGDSFTAGSEVHDHQTWPAQLEGLIGEPVMNGGVGGYGTDQIVMQAERLLPVVRPRVLLVGFLSQDVLRSGFSVYGAPKPYYTVEDDRLILNNVPVPGLAPVRDNKFAEFIKNIAGYSLAVHRTMMAVARDAWLATPRQVYVRVTNDPTEVTCRLLQRLKRKADASGIRMLLVMQYGSGAIQSWTAPSDDAVPINACARTMGIQVVDEFATLKAVYQQDRESLRNYYVMTGDAYGHMSARGNAHVAALIADALQQPAAAGRAEDYTPDRLVPGDGINLIARSESLRSVVAGAAFAALTPTEASVDGHAVYRLAATGATSEHYVSLKPVQAVAGGFTVSMYAKPDAASCLRVVLFDRAQQGMLADFDFAEASARPNPVGTASARRAGIAAAGGGWYRIWLSARLPGDDPQVLLQLTDKDCKESFLPNREAVLLRGVQIERGQSASPYRPTSGPGSPGFVPGDGKNRIAHADAIETIVGQSAIATLAAIEGSSPRAWRLAAAGPAGEHYVGIGEISAEAGPYTLSLEAKAAGTGRLRLQILDGTIGTIGDFDLAEGGALLTQVDATRFGDVDIRPLSGDWRRLTLTSALTTGPAHILLQVMDRDGAGAFAPSGQAIELRKLRLEHGHAASN